MEITFELFNTLQNLEKGGFYKQADRLTNLIHKIYANLLESNLRFAAKPGNSRNTTRRTPVKMVDLRGPNSPLSKPVSLETPRVTLPEQLLPQSPVAPVAPVAPEPIIAPKPRFAPAQYTIQDAIRFFDLENGTNLNQDKLNELRNLVNTTEANEVVKANRNRLVDLLQQEHDAFIKNNPADKFTVSRSTATNLRHQAFGTNPMAQSHFAQSEEALLNYYLENTSKLSNNAQKLEYLEDLLTKKPTFKPFSRILVHDVLVGSMQEGQKLNELVNKFPAIKEVAIQSKLINEAGEATKFLKPINPTTPNVSSAAEKILVEAPKSTATLEGTAKVSPSELKSLGSGAEAVTETGSAVSKGVATEAKALGALEQAGAEAATTLALGKAQGAAKVAPSAVQAAFSSIATKIPILGKVMPFIGKALPFLAMIPSILGVIGDLNKYGIEKIWADNNLRAKFLQNLVEFGGAVGFFVPPPFGLIIGGALTGLSMLMGHGREQAEQRSKDFGSGEYREARDFAYEEIKKNPQISIDNLKTSISSKFFRGMANDMEVKAQYDKLISELPQMIAVISRGLSKFGPNAKWAQVAEQNYRIAKTRTVTASADECNKAVINGIMNSIRTAEKLGYYKEVDEMLTIVKSF